MSLEVDGEPVQTVEAGSLALVAAERGAKLSPAGTAVLATLEGRPSLARRDGWLIADATRGREPALVVAASRIVGSNAHRAHRSMVVPVAADAIGRPLFAQLRIECARGADGSPALATALMNACVVQGLRRAVDAAPDTPRPPAHGGLIARAVAAIRSCPAEAHTVDTLASVAGMSRSSFIRHFKSAFRVAPSEFVQQVRLEEARTMIESTELPIKTIAARTGFASRSHFSRMFRAAFGDDPSSYRERLRNAV